MLSDQSREILLRVSTATLCTLLFKRNLKYMFIQGVSRLNVKPKRLVGPAYTLRYIPAREDLDTLEVFKDPNHPQRAAVEKVPEGHVLVMDCRGDASVASAGSILATRLDVRGCAGLVTDGGLRDAEEIAELDMPVFCAKASAPTNLTKHHGVDLNVPIGCGEVAVYPGDVLVGDGDGVVVLPKDLVEELANEADRMDKFEGWVTARVREGRTIIGLYPPNEETQKEFDAWLAEQ